LSPGKPHVDYSGTPLPKKLGLVAAKGGVGVVALLDEPDGFRELLGDLPGDVTLQRSLRPSTKLALAFIRSRADLALMLDLLTEQLPRLAHVWLIRPKTHLNPDVNEHHVRDAALAIGLVDYKVCSVSEDWSGLKFAWRK
jgi:hypothetical protein